MLRTDDEKSTILVLSPRGHDAQLAVKTLAEADIRAITCDNLIELTKQLGESTSALLIAQEALVPQTLPLLLDELGRQPRWSDVPVIILTGPGAGDRSSLQALEIFGPAA